MMKEWIDENGEVHVGPYIRTPYNYDTDEVSNQTATTCPEPTLTQQQFADDANINVMMERFGVTGEIPQVRNLPTSGDFTNTVNNYQSAMNLLVQAQQEFMRQPANIRARFNNDPQLFMNFMENPDNGEELIRMGLATRRPTPPEEKKEEIKQNTDT